MDQVLLTRAAEAAGYRYAAFLEALRSAFGRISASTRAPGSERARNTLKREAYGLARVYLDAEREEIAGSIDATAFMGQTITEREAGVLPGLDLAGPIAAHAALLVDGLENELRLQVERDVALLIAALRGMALAGMLRGASGASPGAARKRGRGEAAQGRQGALETLAFEFTDRSGRRWPSPRHVKILYRQALVLAWNEAALLAAASIGLDTLEVTHPDANHAASGLLVAVSAPAGPEAMSWDAMRAEGIFHPQTHAWLRPISQE